MNICFVSSELSPYAKVGGLADVSSALPSALARNGQAVVVVLPFYRDLKCDRDQIQAVEALQNVSFQLGSRQITVNGFEAAFPGWELGQGPRLLLVGCDEFYDREGVYGDAEDESLRFLTLSRSCFEFCQRLQFAPDVFHCNDWQTSLIPLFQRSIYSWDELFRNSKSVLTIHNIGHQGTFPAGILDSLNLGEQQFLLHQDDLKSGVINFLKTGILYADVITAVSPTYANQIQTAEYGMGLEGLLQSKSDRLKGILNGIDENEWNPQSDSLIPFHFSASDLDGKRRNKQALLEEFQLEPNLDVPVIGTVSRLAGQKGFELLFDCMDSILQSRDMRFLVLGSGEQKYVDYFSGLKHRFPGKVGFFHGFDNRLAHLIEAGSDMFLMPSRYEPCGLNQMYSQVYGTIPIVRKTGGLADTVETFQPATGKGTGVVFEHFDSNGLHWAVTTALGLFDHKDIWNQMIQNGMAKNFGWQERAREYENLYASLKGN